MSEVTELLRGVLSTDRLEEAMTMEDYARLAQANADFADEMADRLMELTPDQACALFDLARKGLTALGAEGEG